MRFCVFLATLALAAATTVEKPGTTAGDWSQNEEELAAVRLLNRVYQFHTHEDKMRATPVCLAVKTLYLTKKPIVERMYSDAAAANVVLRLNVAAQMDWLRSGLQRVMKAVLAQPDSSRDKFYERLMEEGRRIRTEPKSAVTREQVLAAPAGAKRTELAIKRALQRLAANMTPLGDYKKLAQSLLGDDKKDKEKVGTKALTIRLIALASQRILVKSYRDADTLLTNMCQGIRYERSRGTSTAATEPANPEVKKLTDLIVDLATAGTTPPPSPNPKLVKQTLADAVTAISTPTSPQASGPSSSRAAAQQPSAVPPRGVLKLATATLLNVMPELPPGPNNDLLAVTIELAEALKKLAETPPPTPPTRTSTSKLQPPSVGEVPAAPATDDYQSLLQAATACADAMKKMFQPPAAPKPTATQLKLTPITTELDASPTDGATDMSALLTVANTLADAMAAMIQAKPDAADDDVVENAVENIKSHAS